MLGNRAHCTRHISQEAATSDGLKKSNKFYEGALDPQSVRVRDL